MRDPAEVFVERAILHVLDSEDSLGLVLSTAEIQLEVDGPVVAYVQKHIKKSLTDAVATAARFRSIDSAKASGVSFSMLREADRFVDGSRELATLLFACMRQDKRTAPGDLVVALYRTNPDPDSEHFLALLKINPSNALRHAIEASPLGDRITITVEEDVLQTAGERLQKCGFVRWGDPRPEFDLMVLDRQTGTGTKPVAQFFLDAFLDAEPTFDAKQRTERLYGGLLEAHNTVRPQLSREDNVAVDALIQGVVRSKSVSVDAIMNALPVTPDQRVEFENAISARLPDREFEIEASVANKLDKRRYRAAKGVKFEVLESAYDEVVRDERYDQEGGFTEVVLRVRDWKQVTR